jgi:glutathione peroxidase
MENNVMRVCLQTAMGVLLMAGMAQAGEASLTLRREGQAATQSGRPHSQQASASQTRVKTAPVPNGKPGASSANSGSAKAPAGATAPIHAFEVRRIDGRPVRLAAYRGKVMLIVNTASQCGLTPQYNGLQALHEQYGPKGLAILGFPSNDFFGQEPGTNQEIRQFCEAEYKVSFDMFEKMKVRGDGISPLYRYLTEKATNPWYAGEVRWNFDKFLLDRNGQIVGRFEPRTQPQDETVVQAIEQALAGR